MTIQMRRLLVTAALGVLTVILAASAAARPGGPGQPELLTTLAGGAASGSAIGPGGALYVPQPAAGEIWRIDPESGAKTLYASGYRDGSASCPSAA
jgi:hypothetical protein